jgi:hypothetical protein
VKISAHFCSDNELFNMTCWAGAPVYIVNILEKQGDKELPESHFRITVESCGT